MSPFADRLRNLDTQSAPSQEFRVYTLQGAILSVITVITIIYLVATEWSYNFQVRFSEQVHVNATSPAGLELEFDITLRSLPCSRLNIDANDPNGQAQSLHLDRQHHVWKHKIKYEDDGKLHYVGDRSKLELGSTLLSEDILMNQLEGKLNATREREDENYCGSCYGAGEEGECCNSCDDVKRAYNLKGWVLRDLEQVEQCKEELVHVVEKGEGCNIHGKVALSSGGGNLHLAPGRALQNEAGDNSQISLFDLVLRTFEQWFGEEVPRNPNQLDGEERIIADSYGMYQYYFQVVPTLYKFLNGTTIQTNQYSVTEHLRHVNPGTGRGLPGVFFFYEVSPLHVIIEEEQKGWVAFFTSVCAVVGGVVTAMGILDQSLFAASQKNPQGLAR
ncbi:reticulum-Golgi intermediate compartment protein 3 [Seminavis robusta]|uniref:Reticulum-Golgi intermediate compartment protein 3 n=1 Tax=Seminavis robusta TaxID=568900 RepID=A0A9N8HQQ6_9STRA|nr:reticulum-Golgi intermediate compartment protein 3 [Seminavis robusta]|eukprot:Sro1221_g253710.1 reticulum-Golgi intermediate compartment protein 3 (389) ;mRNA; f:23889-25431